MSHHDFWEVLLRLYQGLLNNPYFPKPPEDLAMFKAKIDEYLAAITETMGRAKIAFLQRDSLREELMKMLFQLAAYVELESHGDPNIFATSGLEAMPNTRVPHKPLDRPRISKVAHGFNSGELRVWMPTSHRKILHCELRHVAVDAED